MPMQAQAFTGVRQQFGGDVTTRLGRIELLGEQGPARQIRFFVIASSSSRQQVPLAFNATVAAQGGPLRFTLLRRDFAGKQQ